MSSKVKPWLVLAVIFVAGVLTGVALTVGLGAHFMRPQEQHDMRKHWLTYLTHELNLTPDQQAKIQPILADAATKLQAVHHDEMERGTQIFKEVHDQISAVLTPEQQVKLQKMESEREKMFSGHAHPWGPSHVRPGGMFKHDGPDENVSPPLPPGQPAPAPQPPAPPTNAGGASPAP